MVNYYSNALNVKKDIQENLVKNYQKSLKIRIDFAMQILISLSFC